MSRVRLVAIAFLVAACGRGDDVAKSADAAPARAFPRM
jgi:hypothetical protein